MDSPTIMVLASVITPLAILNVYASYIIAKAEEILPLRKLLQVLFVWALPVIGACAAIAVHRQHKGAAGDEVDVTIFDNAFMPGQLNNYDVGGGGGHDGDGSH